MLSVNDIHVAYGSSTVLQGVSLEVQAGEIVSVIGRNGVGKTTLLKAIIGLLKVRQGSLAFDGDDLTAVPAYERARRGIGYVPQGRLIFPNLTVQENLQIGADLDPVKNSGMMDEVLDEFPILRERLRQRGGTLSGGQQQMLAIARALVGNPRLLLLDEPSEGIQPNIVHEMEEKIAALNRRHNLSMILVEQNIEFAAALAKRVYVMDKGLIATEISPDKIMDENIVRNFLAV
ncbi:MAG: urea ABC transporter ATP-binding subunit UrtE [SAR324 cluster bacterium]|nr:urea ABC transporter ATP-binding subunit UrtE [SAR324 cluster bacterium]